jgi:hypothetical protein
VPNTPSSRMGRCWSTGSARDHCRRSSRYEPPNLVQRCIAPSCKPRRSVLRARIRSRESREAAL